MGSPSRRALAFVSVLASLGAVAPVARAQRDVPDPKRPIPADSLHFELLGPATGGRIAAIAGVPGDAKVWYVGNASGGVWKSVDSGATFFPVFDREPVQAIGALAVATTKPSVVWAGTGEAWAIRDADVMGDGVYKSVDAGKTWTNMGLRETGRIGRIIVHPRDPNIVYVCALGRTTGPQQERGVYKTTDGGRTWTRVLFVDANTGCSGLTLDAHDPEVLFAGMWQVEMHTWAMFSGGASSGIYVTRNGGRTWTRLVGHGLPQTPLGKIDVAIAPSRSRRVYALVQTTNQGSLWRSDDGGRSWRDVNWTRALIGRAGYYIRLAVSPANADEVLVANSSFFRSLDGGRTFEEMHWGGDNHDIWYDPKNANRFGLTFDAGAQVTTTHGRTWTRIALPNGQMYHVAVDDQTPYWVYTNRQDDGTMRGPSAVEAGRGTRGAARAGGRGTRDGGRAAGSGKREAGSALADSGTRIAGGDTTRPATRVPRPLAQPRFLPPDDSQWEHGLGGCESGFTLPVPGNPDVVWASCYGNEVTRWNAKTKLARSVSPWVHTLDSPPNDTKYRCHWTPPLALDPFDRETAYYGCQVVFKSSDEGQTWSTISPDLSTRDSSRIVSSGGLVGDNLGQFYGEVVFAIAPSEIQRGLIWAGTNDGKLWYTADGGGTWTDVTSNMTGLPAWGTIRKIEPSHFDPATAYVAIDYHMMDDRRPFIYKTTDFGKSWTNITGDLPTGHPLDYVMAVTENPNRRGMLFAGTGHGFYYSLDDGGHWTHLVAGLPAAPVSWIVVPKRWHDVVVSTYGRGIWIMRDITPLEQPAAVAAGDSLQLFAPHSGYRQPRAGRADVTFRLAAAGKKPAKLEILDSAGTTIRTINVLTHAGYDRVAWDLHYDPPEQVALRTLAPDNPHIWDDPRFKGKPTRPITHWGIQGPETTGPIAVPGRYAARLTLDGHTATQPFEVLKDAKIASSDADLVASTKAQIRIRDDMDTTVAMVNRLEVMRKQIEEQRKLSVGRNDVLPALDDLDRKVLGVELRLLSRSDLQSDDKYYVERYRVYLDLVWLNAEVGTGGGDVAGGADYRPTDASLAVLDGIEKELGAAKSAYTKLVTEDLPAFNRLMAGRIANIALSGETR